MIMQFLWRDGDKDDKFIWKKSYEYEYEYKVAQQVNEKDRYVSERCFA